MDSDAYSSFVAVDVEAVRPLCHFGFLGGTLYADTAEARHSLDLVKRGLQFFKAKGAAFAVHLGGVLAAETAALGTTSAALQTFEAERRKHALPWHFCPSAAEYECFGGSQGFTAALRPAREDTSGHGYYSFYPCARWRVVVLDTCEAPSPSTQGSQGSDGAPAGRADASGVGEAQLSWLASQLSAADGAGERVILASHLPMSEPALFNGHAVLERVAAYPGLVVAMLSIGDSRGGTYSVDAAGIHHIALRAASGLGVNENAFGVLSIFEDKLTLEMSSAPPHSSAAPHGGWPSELELPRGGRLVTADSAIHSWVATLMYICFLVMQTVVTPLNPVMRLLMSEPAKTNQRADAAGASDVRDEASTAAARANEARPSAAAAAPPSEEPDELV